MKKMLALILAVVMVCTAAVTVSATTVTSVPDSSNTANVSVAFVNSSNGSIVTAEAVYSVVVEFKDLDFKYAVTNTTNSNSLVWDPDTHTYKGGDDSKTNLTFTAPDSITDAITVTNHSNAVVAVAANFANKEKTSAPVNGVSATLSNEDGNLADASLVAYGNVSGAASLTYNVSVSGTPTSNPYGEFVVDTITVTIAAPTGA